jgi:hypothetical protein
MIKNIRWFSIVFLLLVGCAQQIPQDEQSPIVEQIGVQPMATLLDQQMAAYPMLEDNAYLTLKSFESADELQDFNLIRSGDQDSGESRIIYSASPTATGTGALGVAFGIVDDYSLIFNTPICRWKTYNLLFVAIFIDDSQASCEIELADTTGKTSRNSFLLTKGWNKLQIDLSDAAGTIDLDKVDRVKFSFYQIGNTKIFLDDLILVDYHKTLVGQEVGLPGKIFAIRDGKRIRLGTNGRFEVVFYEGKLIAWYDLSTDRNRTNNLLPPDSRGLELYQGMSDGRFDKIPTGDAVVTAHTQLTSDTEKGFMELTVENYFNTPQGSRTPDQTLVYRIYSDGIILLDITASSETDQLGIGLAVADDQGFDAVIGKMKNPSSAQSRIEYTLFRRMGKKAGSDLLIAFKPWETPSRSVKCKVRPVSKAIQTLFTSDAKIGQNSLQGMIRLWPADIDNISNAEKYIRKYFESSGNDYREEKTAKPSSEWKPTWNLNEL